MGGFDELDDGGGSAGRSVVLLTIDFERLKRFIWLMEEEKEGKGKERRKTRCE